MICKCKQCGAQFELTESEIAFFESKNLSLPKRCKACREQNKKANDGKVTGVSEEKKQPKMDMDFQKDRKNTSINNSNSGSSKSYKRYLYIAIAVVLMLFGYGASDPVMEYLGQSSDNYVNENNGTVIQNDTDGVASDDNSVTIGFRNVELLNEHYEKHGKEMGFSSASAYEAAASAVVSNPASLHKIEAEDGDDVYYLEATNEFVVVSTDGYIRTYFNPNGGKDYFDRQ